MTLYKQFNSRPLRFVLDENDDAARQAALTDYSNVRRTKYLLRFFVDVSGSMFKILPKVISAVKLGLETSANSKVEDYDTLCQIITFAQDVTELNEKPLPPEDLLDCIDFDSIKANGCTNLGDLYQFIASTYTRSNPYIEQSSYGPAPAIRDIILTDSKATDSQAERAKSIQRLEDNTLAQRRQDLLVIHMGDDDPTQNEELVKLVRGKTENLMSMSTFEAEAGTLLAARICQSIINLSDPTYIKNEGAGDNYRDAVKTTDTEKKSAHALSSTSLFGDSDGLRKKMLAAFAARETA